MSGIKWDTPQIHQIRDELKTLLAFQRRNFFDEFQYVPYCSFCGHPLLNGRGDMHEWLITRGDAQGWLPEDRLLIFHEINCVLLHGWCHREFGQTSYLRRVVGRRQVSIYGQRVILDWLPTLPWRAKGAQEHINFIKELGVSQ